MPAGVARPGLRHGPGQHLSPVPRPRPRARRAGSAACTSSCLAPADHHGLGRLPGLLDGARHRRRRDQGPRAARQRPARHGSSRSRRRACASAPMSTARSDSSGPRRRWRSRPRSARTSRWSSTSARRSTSPRLHGALDRAHARWLDRCLAWHDAHGPPGQLVYGIVQGGVYEDLRSLGRGDRRPRVTGSRSAARSAGQAADVRGRRLDDRGEREARPAPARHRRRRRPDPRRRARRRHVRLRDADPARPPRRRDRARPEQRWRVDLTAARYRTATSRSEGCPCPPRRGDAPGYLHYLFKIREMTGLRIVLHNLAYLRH